MEIAGLFTQFLDGIITVYEMIDQLPPKIVNVQVRDIPDYLRKGEFFEMIQNTSSDFNESLELSIPHYCPDFHMCNPIELYESIKCIEFFGVKELPSQFLDRFVLFCEYNRYNMSEFKFINKYMSYTYKEMLYNQVHITKKVYNCLFWHLIKRSPRCTPDERRYLGATRYRLDITHHDLPNVGDQCFHIIYKRELGEWSKQQIYGDCETIECCGKFIKNIITDENAIGLKPNTRYAVFNKDGKEISIEYLNYDEEYLNDGARFFLPFNPYFQD